MTQQLRGENKYKPRLNQPSNKSVKRILRIQSPLNQNLKPTHQRCLPKKRILISELIVDDKMEGPFVADLVVDDREPIPAKGNSGLPILEANSVEDSETTFEEVSEENHETPTSRKLESQAAQLETLARSELEEVPFGLHVVEAKSIEDIQSLLKPVHADEISTVSADLEHRSSEVEPTEVRFETLVYEVHSCR
ncbi:hypothetical protein QJS10_CPB14g00667 [Acorus calamus]|uniref:Uncharacterized protein n=1 Tax=Acorus calamus TaxID=4465 RepID=A0AAV9DFX4_ACOCL|nr:hypothetical protein QJS10_CPB14g00667 [Acorus calamus]